MVKAGALFYVIVISLLVSLFLSFGIIYSYYTKGLYMMKEKEHRLRLNAWSGMSLMMSKQFEVNSEKTFLDLYDTGTDSVELTKKPWGIMDICKARAFSGNKEACLFAETGSIINKKNLTAFYIQNNGYPLYMAGHSEIEGVSYLPINGVLSVFVEGEKFNGKIPLNTEVKTSEKKLPPIEKSKIENLKRLFDGNYFSLEDSVIEASAMSDTIYRSFKESTLIINANQEINLTNKKIVGNVIIVSKAPVFINSSVFLSDVIIVASKISVKDNFKGNAQLFATDTLMIGENCSFSYPSVLGIIRATNSTNSIHLFVDKGTVVNGAVIGIQEENTSTQKLLVTLMDEVMITGMVYVDHMLDLRGVVLGSVWSNKVVLITNSGFYDNHLFNGKISSKEISSDFVFPDFVQIDKKRGGFVKWLD